MSTTEPIERGSHVEFNHGKGKLSGYVTRLYVKGRGVTNAEIKCGEKTYTRNVAFLRHAEEPSDG